MKNGEPLPPFLFNCSLEVFPPEEIDALLNSGSLLEALAAGRIKPANDEQRHFLKVDREEAEPRTLLERAWLRLRGRREFEREEAAKSAKPPGPAETYDMLEWDADRCWW